MDLNNTIKNEYLFSNNNTESLSLDLSGMDTSLEISWDGPDMILVTNTHNAVAVSVTLVLFHEKEKNASLDASLDASHRSSRRHSRSRNSGGRAAGHGGAAPHDDDDGLCHGDSTDSRVRDVVFSDNYFHLLGGETRYYMQMQT